MTLRIRVEEGDDAPITLYFKRRASEGTFIPLDLSGISGLTLYVKNKLADDDGSAKFHYDLGGQIVVVADGSAPGAVNSQVTINISGGDQTPPGNYFFKLVKTKAGKKETIAAGIWTIENT